MKRKKLLPLFLLVLLILGTFTACGKPSEDEIRSKMESHLLEKYGEPFVVENIGMRSANGEKFYQAKIYPKSIVGTPKDDDEYYYGSASIDIDSFGKLDKESGDDYSFIKFNDDTENHLLPKIKELFGEKVRLKVDASLKIRDTEDIIIKVYEKKGVKDYKPQNIFLEYKESNFKKAQKRVVDNPEDNRLELNLYIYVFDKIDNDKEKEEKRKQLFEFLQYLRAEKLGKYLEIFMVFTDDIILAPTFEEKKYDLENNLENRKTIEKALRDDVKNLNNIEYINAINAITKDKISVSDEKDLYVYNNADFLILTMDMLKIDIYGRYEEAKDKNTVERHYYKKPSDIEFSYWDSYLFKDGE